VAHFYASGDETKQILHNPVSCTYTRVRKNVGEGRAPPDREPHWTRQTQKRNRYKMFKQHIRGKIDSLLQTGEITKQVHDFMVVDPPVTSVLYTLPTIHKTYTNVPPGWPIVAAIGSLTEKIATFVDYFRQPLITSLPSYVKDSIEFIKMIQSIQL